MAEQGTIERAREDKHEGKSPSTQAREFVREEFHHMGRGKRGPRSTQQAIAIGLAQARRNWRRRGMAGLHQPCAATRGAII